MDAGKLSERITLKRKSAARDAIGGEVITYPTVAVVWAYAEPIRGRKFEALRIAQSEIVVTFTIYYRADVQPDWRVEWRGRDYALDGPPIDPGATKQWLELNCRSA